MRALGSALLLGLSACCTPDERLDILDPEGLATAEDLAWIADSHAAFVAASGSRRLCLDEIEVIPGLYPSEDSEMALARYTRRMGRCRVELTEQVLRDRSPVGEGQGSPLWHELCHAIDDMDGISDAHPEAFAPEDFEWLTRGYHVPEGDPEAEIFALLCQEGPPESMAMHADASCEVPVDEWARVLGAEVYQTSAVRATEDSVPIEQSVQWWPAPPEELRLVRDGLPFGEQLLFLITPELGEPRELWRYGEAGLERTPLPESWGDAYKLWPALDGSAWIGERDRMAPVALDGSVGAEQPLHDTVRLAEHLLMLDAGRALAYLEDLRASAILDPETGETLALLPEIWEDNRGYTVLDGEVWVLSDDGGPFRLDGETWTRVPAPAGLTPLLQHQGALLGGWSAWSPGEFGASAGGLALIHEDGSWTPMGDPQCEGGGVPQGYMLDLGERVVFIDPIDQQTGWLELSW